MKPKLLLFDFSINENNTIEVKREFSAELQRVWDAWTKAELLEKWWAPQPYRIETKSMDFTEGGNWHYAMVSPEGEKHWCKFHYCGIAEGVSFRGKDFFCDEQGNRNEELPKTTWCVVFNQVSGITCVTITLKFKSVNDLKTIIDMGFKEGFEMSLNNLEELLESENYL